jgi:hypothetical protein
MEFSKHARTLERVAATSWAGRFGAILTGRGPAKSYLTIPVTADSSRCFCRTFTNEDLRDGCAVRVVIPDSPEGRVARIWRKQ